MRGNNLISLKNLYDFVYEEDKQGLTGKGLDNGTDESKEYMKRVRELVADVEETRGVYLFGSYDFKGRWKNIYVGMTSNLKTRLYDQLNWARLIIWRTVLKEDQILILINKKTEGRI